MNDETSTVTADAQPTTLKDVVEQRKALLARVTALRRSPSGTDWYADARKSLLSIVGTELATELRNRARVGNATLLHTDADGTTIEDTALEGLAFINTYPELRIEAVRIRLAELGDLDVDALPAAKRRTMEAWARGLDQEFAGIEADLALAESFLARRNVERLPLALPTEEARERVKRLSRHWKLPQAPIRI